MSNDLVSVIIPVYNVEQYVEECLLSVMRSTYENLEIIIINDGSQDDSMKIVYDLADNDSRIKIINQRNGGISKARNTGINHATGKYIMFVDSDDVISAQMIANLCFAAEEGQASLVETGYSLYSDTTKKVTEVQMPTEIQILTQDECIQHYLNRTNSSVMLRDMVWGRIYLKSMLEEYFIRFPEGRDYEDAYFTPEILCNLKKYIFLPGGNYFYRMRSDSIVHSKLNHRSAMSFESAKYTHKTVLKVTNQYEELTAKKWMWRDLWMYEQLAQPEYVGELQDVRELIIQDILENADYFRNIFTNESDKKALEFFLKSPDKFLKWQRKNVRKSKLVGLIKR